MSESESTSEYERWKRWSRSSPWIGTLGGLLYAGSYHLGGVPPGGDRWLYRLLPTEALFGVHPAVGYACFVVLGFGLGWAFRAFEDRYVWHDE